MTEAMSLLPSLQPITLVYCCAFQNHLNRTLQQCKQRKNAQDAACVSKGRLAFSLRHSQISCFCTVQDLLHVAILSFQCMSCRFLHKAHNTFINLCSSYAAYMLALHVVLRVSRKGIPVHSSQRQTKCREKSRGES